MSEAAFILTRVGQPPSDRAWLRFQDGAPVWVSDRDRAAAFADEASALALVDRNTGPAFERRDVRVGAGLGVTPEWPSALVASPLPPRRPARRRAPFLLEIPT